MKGRLRESLSDLCEILPGLDSNWINSNLSPDSRDGRVDVDPGFSPRRGRLAFSDFVCHAREESDRVDHRIQRDPVRKAVRAGHFQVIASPFRPNEDATFEGSLEFFAGDEAEARNTERILNSALRWIPSFGANRTTGYGRLVDVEVTVERSQKPQAASAATNTAAGSLKTTAFGLRLRPKRDFCVTVPGPEGNLFRSSTVLTGAVIKGIIASTLRELSGLSPNGSADEVTSSPWDVLGRNLHLLRITHAFPVEQGSVNRPVEPPLSIIKPADEVAAGGSWFDVALEEGPILPGGKAPAFAVDWKDDSDIRSAFGWGDPSVELRVRTAMNSGKRRSESGLLFAQELIHPDGFDWLGTIDVSAVAESDRTSTVDALRALFEFDLRHLGKTKSTAAAALLDEPPARAGESLTQPHSDRWIVTLQSPTLLVDVVQQRRRTSGGMSFSLPAIVGRHGRRRTGSDCRTFFCTSAAGGG